jgi:hypothetical protein
MPKSSEIATALRILADSLDKHPDLEQKKPWVNFYCYTKEEFLNAAKIMPKPYAKQDSGGEYPRIYLKYENESIDLNASIYKSETCEIVEPAKPAVYRCDPILSAIEEASL